nr:hypothetical protein [Tanacetum cinerariifolium]
MDTEEISGRYVAPCFVNGLESYDGKIGDDWDLLLDDLDFGDIPDIKGVEIPPFMCKMRKSKKSLTREEAEREALTIDICRRYSLLEDEIPVIETMAYSDTYKKILDGICLDKMKLDGEIKKEGKEAIIKIKGEALIEKENPGAFELGREELKNVNKGITMLNHSKAEPMGILKVVLCQAVLNPFRKVCVWKKVVSFLGSLPVPLQHVLWKPGYTGVSTKRRKVMGSGTPRSD